LDTSGEEHKFSHQLQKQGELIARHVAWKSSIFSTFDNVVTRHMTNL